MRRNVKKGRGRKPIFTPAQKRFVQRLQAKMLSDLFRKLARALA